jgi:signal transduction histidine kinase
MKTIPDPMHESRHTYEPGTPTLNTIFNHSPFGIAVLNQELIESVNQQFCDILSKSRNQIIGKPIKTIFGDQDEYLKIIHLETFETRIKLSSGQQILLVSPKSVLYSDGKEKILLFISDISQFKSNVQPAQEISPEFYSIFNLSPSLLLLLDEYTNVININDTALNLVSKARDNIIGLRPGNVLNCIRSYDSPRGCGNGPQCKNCIVRKTVLETLLTGKSNYRVESPFPVRHNHGVTMLTVLVTSVFMKRDDAPAVLVAIDDITERKQLEVELALSKDELKRKNSELQAVNLKLMDSFNKIKQINRQLISAKEKAEESDQLKSAFLANISHEVRTPLNGILGFLELLASNNLSKAQRDLYTKVVNQSADQLLHIMTDIIEIAMIESGQIRLNYERIDLTDVLNGIYKCFENDAISKGLQFKLKYDSGKANTKIISDSSKLTDILSRLLDNAIKFTFKGKVEFGFKFLVNHSIEFYVSDTGIGIDPENSHSVFEHFRQIELSDTRNYGGTGLGLSIARAYVHLLGGKIWFESTPGRGAKFYFTIPYSLMKKDINSMPTTKSDAGKIDWSDKTFLIVEDEEVNVHYLQELLGLTKAKLLYASDAESAISTCTTNSDIDLVLMDIKLPDMDGYRATQTIRKLRPDLPIIAQTAYAMTGDRMKAIESGCCDYIAKPIRSTDLMTMLQRWLKE